ncbi:MAG: hotdog fold domain-containing protein [Pseudomonadota bacterium]
MARVATDVHPARPQMDWLTMTDTTQAGPTLRAWIRAHRSAFGRWLFARTVCKRAPYFATIKPRFLDLQPTLCRVAMQKRRAVENHIHTVHALAMGNLCELAAGLCTEVTIPVGMRWIPRGMTIEYLAKAETDVIATARLDKTEWAGAENIGVPVTVTDTNGKEVVRAVISMYVSPKKES